MTLKRQNLGRTGEDLALEYLRKKGYFLIGRNIRLFCGEIDLLMQDKKVLVIVEVKTKSNRFFGLAEEEVDRRKQKKLLTLAKAVASQYTHQSVRIDVVAINDSAINHIVNAIEG